MAVEQAIQDIQQKGVMEVESDPGNKIDWLAQGSTRLDSRGNSPQCEDRQFTGTSHPEINGKSD
jgi:hypothetical protein